MPNFDYTALHDDGRTIRATAMGETVEEVIQDLALKGMLVTKIGPAVSINDPIPANYSSEANLRPQATRASVPQTAPSEAPKPVAPSSNPYSQPVPPAPIQHLEEPETGPSDQRSYFATSVAGPLVGTVPLADLQMFFRQFGTMQNAGVPTSKSLETLSKQSRIPKLTRILLEMSTATEQGRPVSSVMQRYPEVFTPLMVSLTRAGEEGGFLQSSLVQVSEYIASEIQIRNMWRKATLYPKIVIGASILIVLATNAIIASLGKTGGLSSPLTTASVVIVVVPLLIAAFLYFRVGLANPRVKYNWDQFTLMVPFVGQTLQQFAMAKFGRAFGALHKGAVPVGKALTLAADACGNEYIRSKIHPVAKKLEDGDGIAGTLAETGVMSPIVLDMLQTGETSGNIDTMLERAAEHYEQEATMRSNQLAVTMGVVCMVVVAIYVGYIVISFYTGGFAAPLQDAARQADGLITW